MVKRCLSWAILVTATVGLAGCTNNSTEPTILQARAQPYVQDVPVPKDFELDRRRSTHDFSPGKREVQHFYLGKAAPLAVKNFYRQRMQEAGWELIDDQLKTGVFFLNYRNADDTCEVRIEEVPKGMSTQTQVRVDIKRKY